MTQSKKHIVDPKGYVSIWRRISDNDLWLSEKFTRGQAWVDLILLANHKDGFFYIRDNKIIVKRGQLARSEQSLSERWGWSRGKLRTFLRMLESEQQIFIKKSNIINTISIINYDIYQKIDDKKDSRKTTERLQENINNNNNNLNTDNKVNIGASKLPKKTKRKEFEKPDYIDKQVWQDFKELRRMKKAPISKTAFTMLENQAIKAGISTNDAIAYCVGRNWQSFNAEWYANAEKLNGGNNGNNKSGNNTKGESYTDWVMGA